jgi:hypothetical protein
MPETTQGSEHLESANFAQTSIKKIDAELVRMSQSSAGHIQAEEVDVRQGGIVKVDAGSLSVHQGGVILARTKNLNMENSSLVAGRAGEASFDSSQVGALYSPSVEMKYSKTNLMVAQRVSGGPIRSLILLAGKVDGPVNTYLDTPRTLLAGIAAGASLGMVLLLGRLLSRR